jgi:hypothetical protein
VPGTGFEPAHPCERCDLNTVRLPISPSGLFRGSKGLKGVIGLKGYEQPVEPFELFQPLELSSCSGLQIYWLY